MSLESNFQIRKKRELSVWVVRRKTTETDGLVIC